MAKRRAAPWNKASCSAKSPLKLKEIWAIRIRLQLAKRARELALLTSPLTASYAAATWLGSASTMWSTEVVSPPARVVLQKKTQKSVQFEINEQTPRRRRQLDRRGTSKTRSVPISEPRIGVAPSFNPPVFPDRRVVVASIGLDPAAYGAHSLRRTKATLIHRRTRNLRAVRLLLGHTKLESTVRYLGIEVDDALEIAQPTEV